MSHPSRTGREDGHPRHRETPERTLDLLGGTADAADAARAALATGHRAQRTLLAELADLGRADTGGYRRFAWTAEDAALTEWFAHQAAARGLEVTRDRAGNQWAWWGDPDAEPGLVTGSHLDSVPDGGPFDGPLGVVSAFAALDVLRAAGHTPGRPLGVVTFRDEEGARFGVACGGSRLITGALPAERALGLRDRDGIALAEAMRRQGHRPEDVGPDREALSRVGTFVELHVEQGRALVDLDRPVAVGTAVVPHGRWRLDLAGEANHAGTTLLEDRRDPMLTLAEVVLTARRVAARHGCVATIGKVTVRPNGVNAIPSSVTAWLDARGPRAEAVRAVAEEVGRTGDVVPVEESFSTAVTFEHGLGARISGWLDDAPLLATGAGHDAGIMADAGIPTAMLFVRNPTGVSHSPAEHAEAEDCDAGVSALARVLARLSVAGWRDRAASPGS